MPGETTLAPVLIALGLLGALGPPAPAGEAEAMVPDSRLGTRVAPLLLLGRPDIRADLRLEPRQAESARRAIADLYARAVAIRSLTGPEAVAARRAIDDAQRRWIEAELNAEQQGRLDQLDLQWEGPAALVTRPAIADTLALSPAQREGLARAVGRRQDLRRRQGYRIEDDKALAREALALLSTEQRDRWLAMLGTPYHPRVARAQPASRKG